MDLKETYNIIAEEWHKDHTHDDWWLDGTNEFVGRMPAGALVLDVGCGSGVKSKYLIEKGLQVVGIDFADKLLEIAKREVPDAEFRVLDMKDVQTLPEQFDGIFAQASFLHIPKKELSLVIDSLVEKLNPGGVLYAAVKGMKEGGIEEEVKEENDYGYSYKRFFSYYSMTEMIGYFEAVGLHIVYTDIKKGKSDWIQIIGQKSL